MTKAEITPGIIGPSPEEIESLTGEGAKEGLIPWIPKEWKKGIATILGITGVAGAGAIIWEINHPPAIVEKASQYKLVPTYTPTPKAPEIVIPSGPTTKDTSESQLDLPSTEIPPEWQSLIGKEPEEEIKGPTVYTVKEGDTLTKIAQEHNNIPWEIIYNMNGDVIGDNPDKIKPGMELLIIHWGPAEASRDFVYKKLYETQEKGEEITWIYFNLNREATIQEVAEFFGIKSQNLAELNKIEDSTARLPKDYYLMIPVEDGFAFTQTDREAGRRWVPTPGISLDAVWWENPTGEGTAGPWYPNEAYAFEPYPKEYWVEATWSTADNLDPEFWVPEIITDTPANRTIEITDENGNVRYEEREGFKVYGKHRIVHTEYRRVEAGKWVIPEPTA